MIVIMTTVTQIHKSRQYAQAFGRSVYTDILRWGDSEMLSESRLLLP